MQANGFGGASPPTSLRAKEQHGSGALAFFNPALNQSLADQFKSCGLLASRGLSSLFQESADLVSLRRSMNSLANQNDECAYSNGKKGIVEEGHESWTP